MTNAKLAADARRLAGDKEPYEPEDDIIAGYIDRAITWLTGLRGDALIASDESAITVADTPEDLTGDCSLADVWRECLANYVGSMIAGNPGAMNDSERAARLLRRAVELAGSL